MRTYTFFDNQADAETFCTILNGTDNAANAYFRELPDGRGTSIWIAWFSQKQSA